MAIHTKEKRVTTTTPPPIALALIALLILATQQACETPHTEPPVVPATIEAPTPPIPPPPKPTDSPSAETEIPELPAEIPPSGVLAKRDSTPRGSPRWLKVQAEVIERDGKRILRASHFAKHIKNASLAQQTAANRARHELTKWLGTPTLEGAVVTDSHWSQKAQLSATRIEIELPPSWLPPESDQPETQREDSVSP